MYARTSTYLTTVQNLVYTSFGASGAGDVHDFRACRYNGSDHLCMYEGLRRRGYARFANLTAYHLAG